MKEIMKIERDILNILLKMNHEFPELSKYISEMPIHYEEVSKTKIGALSFKEFCNSLDRLVVEYAKSHPANRIQSKDEKVDFPGYSAYPVSEDMYVRGREETTLNPEDISKVKSPNEEENTLNEKGFKNHMSGDDLDIPGSELDDQQESVGSEDEENNYYSLGGDNHTNLEEENG